MYAALLEDPTLEPPFVTLVVSGGHTLLIAMDDHGRYRVLGQTVDDAAGEAFDKVARFLGLGYPGRSRDRPARGRAAIPDAIAFPRPMLDDGNDFSFSGLKTAVVQYVRKHPDAEVADVAASFQAAVVDVLVAKLAPRRRSRPGIVDGGDRRRGRRQLRAARPPGRRGPTRAGCGSCCPSIGLCTDNAAMVAAVGLVAPRRRRPDLARRRRLPGPAHRVARSAGAPGPGGLPWCPGGLVPLALDVWEC